MSSQELVKFVAPSDEVAQREQQTYREYFVAAQKEGFLEIDGVDHDQEHPDFDSMLLAQRVGEVTRLRVVVIPVNEELDPWAMDLHDYDQPRATDIVRHPYAYGSKRGIVPETSDISLHPRAA